MNEESTMKKRNVVGNRIFRRGSRVGSEKEG